MSRDDLIKQFGEKSVTKGERLINECGPDAIEAFRKFYTENEDGVVAITEDNPDYEGMIPWMASMEAKLIAVIQTTMADNPIFEFVMSATLEQFVNYSGILLRTAYFKGYQRALSSAKLSEWRVAEE